LRQGCVGGRGKRGMPYEHSDAAEDRLREHQRESRPTELTGQGPAVGARYPDCQDQRQDGDEAGQDAVRVLEADAANQRRDDPSVSEGPIGYRVRGVIAGNQRPGHQ
jgi:hypothetical protein